MRSPIIPKVGVQLSSILPSTIIYESIFNWPGIGRWLLDFSQIKITFQANYVVVATHKDDCKYTVTVTFRRYGPTHW